MEKGDGAGSDQGASRGSPWVPTFGPEGPPSLPSVHTDDLGSTEVTPTDRSLGFLRSRLPRNPGPTTSEE